MQWQVALNNDSFDRAGITKDCKDAVCEYIWNSFEAGASKVSVSMTGSPLREAREPLNKSAAVLSGSFTAIYRFLVSNLNLRQKLWLTASADCFRVSLAFSAKRKSPAHRSVRSAAGMSFSRLSRARSLSITG